MAELNYDPRQRALEVSGRTGKKLLGNALEVGVSAARGMQNAIYPNEFEYYALTLELVNSVGATVEFLTFPVMPESMAYDDMKVANIQKTLGGISSIDNDSYTPKTVDINGTFGKRFKLLLKPSEKVTGFEQVDTSNFVRSFDAGQVAIKKPVFDERLKSGFGATKLLEKIISMSSLLDEYGEPYRLYLYNPVLGHNFVVKCTRFQLNMDRSTNTMWRYTVQLTVIAPLDAVVEADVIKNSLQRNLKIDLMQKAGTEAGNTIVASLRSYLLTTPGNQ